MKAKFVRGQDPKAAMGIGEYSKGYKIVKEWDFGATDRYVRFDFQGEEWNFSKKTFDPDEIGQSKVTPEMAKKIEPLPVVDFIYYWETMGLPGMFGDWPSDFPFTSIPFIANVQEGEGRSYLIEPEGYDYPRYITELV